MEVDKGPALIQGGDMQHVQGRLLESSSNVGHVGDILVQAGNRNISGEGQGDAPAQMAEDEAGPKAIRGRGGRDSWFNYL
jgi:hypothetical protein